MLIMFKTWGNIYEISIQERNGFILIIRACFHIEDSKCFLLFFVWFLIGTPTKNLFWEVIIKDNSTCFEKSCYFWEIDFRKCRQTNFHPCWDCKLPPSRLSASPVTSHADACAGTNNRRPHHTESNTNLRQTSPFPWAPTRNLLWDTYLITKLINLGFILFYFNDLERQGCWVYNIWWRYFLQKSLTNHAKRFEYIRW